MLPAHKRNAQPLRSNTVIPLNPRPLGPLAPLFVSASSLKPQDSSLKTQDSFALSCGQEPRFAAICGYLFFLTNGANRERPQ